MFHGFGYFSDKKNGIIVNGVHIYGEKAHH
jgi:hypothetical protein